MIVDDQEEKIILTALLGGVWLGRNTFMAELLRKAFIELLEFMVEQMTLSM